MKLIWFLITGLEVFSGCREIYYPEVDSDFPLLAVDGMLTDTEEPYYIQLNLAKPFDSTGIGTAVKEANVSVSDDSGNLYQFNYYANGSYVSDYTIFKAQASRKYTLHISTSDGNKYESSAQELIPNKGIDKIYGSLTTKSYAWKNYYGQTIRKDFEGIETFIDVNSVPGQSYAFKFNVNLFIEYTYTAEGSKYYAWRIQNLYENINLTGTRYQNDNNEIVAHSLSLFPIEKSWYSLDANLWQDNFNVVNWILIIEQFRLNEDSYNFYQKARELFVSEGKLFDPMSVQINGNVRCTNDPRQPVLGNFEVSSKETLTYLVKPEPVSHEVSYLKIPNFKSIPGIGSSLTPPDFWIK